MVAVIKSSASIKNVLQYNENKLKENVAELIHSVNYLKDTDKLGYTDKFRTLQKFTSLNERTRLNAVHISLNFDPSEKLERETLQQIAETYMNRIGFGNQPFLVYQHHDAGHPHIHIVTTNIQRDGKRIPMQNIGRNQSERARKEIETEFKLVKAQRQQHEAEYSLKPVNAQKLQYGKFSTKRAISNILTVVLTNYKYSSLPELNAILQQYNIIADRGGEDSRTYKSNGLVYRALDDQGNKISAPIKASSLRNNPGLKYLKQRFAENESLKKPHRLRVRNAIDFSFAKQQGQTLNRLIKALQKEKIQVVLRQNDQGVIYGLTYIDHHTKCVFNGSELGKAYSANQIQQRCSQMSEEVNSTSPSLKPTHDDCINQSRESKNISLHVKGLEKVAGNLIETENETALATDLRNDDLRKKKRRKINR